MNKRFFAILCMAIAILVCNMTAVFCESSIIREILKMHQSGINEETILMYLQSRNADIEVNSEDLVKLKNAGFSEEFIQALLQMRRVPDYDFSSQMYDYGSSYFSYSLGFNYACVQNTGQKSYFYSGGHAYIRHNGHFHLDDSHQFQAMPNINQLSENAFINQRSSSSGRIAGSFKGVAVKNHWSGKSPANGNLRWGTKPALKSSRPAGSFHGIRSGKSTGKIGFSSGTVSKK
jgi:hypothetical protein